MSRLDPEIGVVNGWGVDGHPRPCHVNLPRLKMTARLPPSLTVSHRLLSLVNRLTDLAPTVFSALPTR